MLPRSLALPQSFTTRYWLLIILGLMLALGSGIGAVWLSARSTLVDLQSQALLGRAQEIARSLDAQIGEDVKGLEFLAAQRRVTDALTDGGSALIEARDIVSDFALLARLNRITAIDQRQAVVLDHRFAEAQDWRIDPLTVRTLAETALSSAAGEFEIVFRQVGQDSLLAIGVPILHRGFVEGAMIGEFVLDLSVAAEIGGLARDVSIVDTLDGEDSAAIQSAAIGSTGLYVRMVAEDAVVRAGGNRILRNATFGISGALLVSFLLIGVTGRRAILRPHAELSQSRRLLKASNQRLKELAQIAERANDSLLVTDPQGKTLWANAAFERLSGYFRDEIEGKVPGAVLQGPQTDPDTTQSIADALRERQPIRTDILNYRADGTPYWIELSIAPLWSETGALERFVAVSRDITLQRQREADLRAEKRKNELQALHDPLTGLPNRRYLDTVLSERLEEGADHQTLVRIDLDFFKHVNDTLGHAAGDFVLTEVARILKESLREGDFTARVGGDEFVVLLRGATKPEVTEALVRRLQERIREDMVFEGKTCRVGASFGIATVGRDDLGDQDLLSCADAALYVAKESGRNLISTYTRDLHDSIRNMRELAQEIQTAIAGRQFVPYFQPQVEAGSLELCGVEVLARWRHPTRGLLGPEAFLGVAESISVVPDLDRLIIEQVSTQIDALAKTGTRLPKVSFNVTASSVQDPRLIELCRGLVEGGTRVAFELVESILIEEESQSFSYFLDQVKAAGIEIEIDDFGSGHASIIGLMHAAPNAMKIDQRLIFPLTKSRVARRLVEAIVDIGRALDIAVTAEGVETLEHARILRDIGCTALQGYFFGRAVPPEDLELLAGSGAIIPIEAGAASAPREDQ